MQGIEIAYCNVCIHALIGAWQALMENSATELLNRTRYGKRDTRYSKSDTLGLDAIPEIIINDRLLCFDRHSILVTEELDETMKKRWPSSSDPVMQPLMFFSDPVDRSKQFKTFLEVISDQQRLTKIGDILLKKDAVKIWEELFEAPAVITGATSSITCVRKGSIVFSLIMNIITKTIFVATPIDVRQLKLPEFRNKNLEKIDLEHLGKYGSLLIFPPSRFTCSEPVDYKRFVTFLGKTGYRENFNDSMIFVQNPDEFLLKNHTEPGGPARILYLSELQKGFPTVGFIMANGEKIGEWIHWLGFVKYARNKKGDRALKVFEISIERPWTKEGILMSTSLPYSIFREDDKEAYFDISQLKNFVTPSKFRSMLVVTPYDNERIIYVMRQHDYRDVSGSF